MRVAIHRSWTSPARFMRRWTLNCPLLNLPREFDAGNDDGGMAKALETQHGARATLDTSVVLFDDIIEVSHKTGSAYFVGSPSPAGGPPPRDARFDNRPG